MERSQPRPDSPKASIRIAVARERHFFAEGQNSWTEASGNHLPAIICPSDLLRNAGQCLIQVYFFETALRELESRAESGRQGTDKTGSLMTKLEELKKRFIGGPGIPGGICVSRRGVRAGRDTNSRARSRGYDAGGGHPAQQCGPIDLARKLGSGYGIATQHNVRIMANQAWTPASTASIYSSTSFALPSCTSCMAVRPPKPDKGSDRYQA